MKLRDHPILKKIEIDLASEKILVGSSESPFTSLIIGMNGTGKSRVLRAITEIFEKIDKHYFASENPKIYFGFHFRYTLDGVVYDLYNHRIHNLNARSEKNRVTNQIYLLKNRPKEETIFNEKEFLTKPNPDYAVELERKHLPFRVIASTTQLNDRFLYKKFEENTESDIYQYLGVKSTPRNISTKSYERNITKLIYKSAKQNNFKIHVGTVLEHLGLEQDFCVEYKTSNSSRFFHPNVSLQDFKDYYDDYKKFRTTKPWGKWKYDQLTEKGFSRIYEIIAFIKQHLQNTSLFKSIPNSNAKMLTVDLFNDDVLNWDFSIIQDLDQLDLINLENIQLNKAGSSVSLNDSSAGEYQIVMSLLGLFSSMKNNSLVLIDEPEISLHPNWQMSFVELLVTMFKSYTSSQFIIASHSHFLVSSLQPNHSSLTALEKQNSEIISTAYSGTYGWSAEEILFKVFGVKTSRNYYLEIRIQELLHMLSNKSEDKDRLQELTSDLSRVAVDRNDPLTKILNEANEYIRDL